MSTEPEPTRTPQPATTHAAGGATAARSSRAQQKDKFGGMRFGVAFFGWLSATGLSVLLLAILSGIGAAIINPNGNGNAADAVDQAQDNPTTSGIVGTIILLAILLVSYYAGGYVAGRMARFSGIKQGIAVWLWAIIVTVVLAIVAAIAGAQFDALSRLGTLPEGTLDGDNIAASIVGILAVAVITLVGAILGGLAGMHYHRKVDQFRDDATLTTT